jgi:hypothetical protein
MANLKRYVPKADDLVLVKGKPNRYVVVGARAGTKTADVRTAAGPVILYYDVAWPKLSLVWMEAKANPVRKSGEILRRHPAAMK